MIQFGLTSCGIWPKFSCHRECMRSEPCLLVTDMVWLAAVKAPSFHSMLPAAGTRGGLGSLAVAAVVAVVVIDAVAVLAAAAVLVAAAVVAAAAVVDVAAVVAVAAVAAAADGDAVDDDAVDDSD